MICKVKSIKDGVILQVLHVKGTLSEDGTFTGSDGMVVKLTRVSWGWDLIKKYPDNHYVQYYIGL